MTEEQKQAARHRIGHRIADLRKAIKWKDNEGKTQEGITQAQLAERCGLAQSHIARIENGRYSVGFDQLQVIADALGKKVDIV